MKLMRFGPTRSRSTSTRSLSSSSSLVMISFFAEISGCTSTRYVRFQVLGPPGDTDRSR